MLMLLSMTFSQLAAQRLLVDEKFATDAWQREFKRLNPTYTFPTPGGDNNSNASYNGLSGSELYFGKYKIANADIETIRVLFPSVTTSVSGDSYNAVANVALGLRFNNDGTTVFELPELPGADTLFLNIRCGNFTDPGSVKLERYVDENWVEEAILITHPKNDYKETSVDELIAVPINSLSPVKLRVKSHVKFANLYRIRVQEHIFYSLENAIASAEDMMTDNASNLGDLPSQYPASAYNDLLAAVSDAQEIYEDESATHQDWVEAYQALQTAVSDFELAMNPIHDMLLIDETFASTAWQEELLRLNPGEGFPEININNTDPYAVPVPGGPIDEAKQYMGLNFTDLYFDNYLIKGDIEGIRASIPNRPRSLVSVSGGDFNINDFALGFRFKNDNTSWVELPELSSAGDVLLNMRSGHDMYGGTLYLEKKENEDWVQIDQFQLQGRNNYHETTVDELINLPVNAREPVQLRIKGATERFSVLFRFRVTEHFSAPLKTTIDEANDILSENADNIGDENGQYPQAAYDDFDDAVGAAAIVFEDASTTPAEVEQARLLLEAAIDEFAESVIDVNVGTNQIDNAVLFMQHNRSLTMSQPVEVSVYNILGTLVYHNAHAQQIEIPESAGDGIFFINFASQSYKIILK